MKLILIDTSVWIQYFAGDSQAEPIDILIDKNKICTNKLILCELIPFLADRNENHLIKLLKSIPEIPINVSWEKIIQYQIINLKNNIRKIGIPDLIILDNIIANKIEIFTFDKHFLQMKKHFPIKIFNY